MALEVPRAQTEVHAQAQTEVHAQALAVQVKNNVGHFLVFLPCLSKSKNKMEVVAGQGTGEVAKCN